MTGRVIYDINPVPMRTYVVLDFETTGLSHVHDSVIEIAAIKLDANFNEIASFQTLVKLDMLTEVPEFITGLTGITTEMTRTGMTPHLAFNMLLDFIGVSVVVAQWAPFDLAFLKEKAHFEPEEFICTKSLTSLIFPEKSSSLGPTCERLGIELSDAHRALADTRATAEVLKTYISRGHSIPSNTIAVSPGRPLQFIPYSTSLILTKSGEEIAKLSK